MDSVTIEYRIKLSEHETQVFDFNLDSKTFELIADEVTDPPQWAALSFNQCAHCPLDTATVDYCPVALQLHNIVARFHGTRSIDKVELEVITEERRVIQTLDIQQAIASMLDLVMPICGCPQTAWMKPLARFHLPSASEEETVFRVTGMYLLAQYFVSLTSNDTGIEFAGLTKIYENLHTLNAAVASRLQTATQSDSVKNAITLVDMYSMLVPALLEDELVEMRSFFKAYLPKTPRAAREEHSAPKHLEQAKAFRLDPDSYFASEMEVDLRPSWLQNITRSKEPEKNASSGTSGTDKEKQKIIETILSKSGLNLELEPLDDEPEEGSNEEAEPDTPKSGKAVFRLADD